MDISKIRHIDDIAQNGPFLPDGTKQKGNMGDSGKMLESIHDAIVATGLKDGMTISFHHHFRNGDYIVNMVLDEIAKMGIKNLTVAASSLASCHAPMIEHIKNGVVTHIETSGMRGELAEQISRGLMDFPVVFRSHGGRAAAIARGELHIDVAFLGAPSCDPLGNANGYNRDEEGATMCGSLGYAKVDAEYADKVVIITDHVVPYPNTPFGIPAVQVDYIVPVENIGDPAGIMSGATRFTKNPKELLIAKAAAEVIMNSGYFYDGFAMQMGSGGASLATVRFHAQIDGCFYAGYDDNGAAVNALDFVVLSALEIDTDFNVNVLTGSDGVIRGAIGGHPDTAAGAGLSVVVGPLTRGRIPTVVKEVNTVVTPGSIVDVFVTEQGIAVNPRRQDIIEKMEAAGIEVTDIETLREKAEKIVGKPDPIKHLDRVVGVVLYRDNTVIDQIKQIDESAL